MSGNSKKDKLPMRIGLFGGTFNPVHRAHEFVAREVMRRFELDRVYFIPCAIPPHKMQGLLAPAADRLEMARRALRTSPQMAVSDIEIQRRGPSYTIDTMRQFKAASSADDRLFFLLGLDAFLEIHTWKAFQLILDNASLIVMSRPMTQASGICLQQTASAYAQTHLSETYCLSGDGHILRHPDKQPIMLADVTPMDIASSRIRREIKQGGSIDQWVSPAVAQYIDQKGLYQ